MRRGDIYLRLDVPAFYVKIIGQRRIFDPDKIENLGKVQYYNMTGDRRKKITDGIYYFQRCYMFWKSE